MQFIYRVRRHERGLHFRHGELKAVLAAGTYRNFGGLINPERERIEVVSTLDPIVQHDRLAEFIESPAFQAATSIVEIGDSERARVWKDGRLVAVIGPGSYPVWNPAPNETTRLRVERFDPHAPRLVSTSSRQVSPSANRAN